jgi:hypothetical protein
MTAQLHTTAAATGKEILAATAPLTRNALMLSNQQHVDNADWADDCSSRVKLFVSGCSLLHQ